MDREDMSEVYGEEFVENLEQEFDIPPEDMEKPLSYHVKERIYFATETIKDLLKNGYVLYFTGLLDGLLVGAVVYLLLK